MSEIEVGIGRTLTLSDERWLRALIRDDMQLVKPKETPNIKVKERKPTSKLQGFLVEFYEILKDNQGRIIEDE